MKKAPTKYAGALQGLIDRNDCHSSNRSAVNDEKIIELKN